MLLIKEKKSWNGLWAVALAAPYTKQALPTIKKKMDLQCGILPSEIVHLEPRLKRHTSICLLGLFLSPPIS